MNDLKNRAVTFIISLILVSALLLFSKKPLFAILFLITLLAIISIALWEFYSMASIKQFHPLYTLGIVGGICYTTASFLAMFYPGWVSIPTIILGLLLFLFFFQNIIRIKTPLSSVSVSYFGIFYIVVSLTFLLKINFFFPLDAPISGQWWLMYLLIVTKSTDLGAYFIGKKWGKRPLAPLISPNKTIEGLIGGLIASLVASVLLIFLTPHVLAELKHPWSFAIIMSLILSIFGQFSDLAESLIKRDVGVKDSNRIKGSGGILDMVDSMIFTSPIFYLYLLYGHVL